MRLCEAGDRDGGAGREILAEDFVAKLRHARGVSHIDEKYRHGDEVAELGAGLGERLLDIAKALPDLRVEIAGERFTGIVHRAGMPGDP